MEATLEEQKIIKSLKRLAKKWPKGLWLYSASGTLCVMRTGPNGVVLNANGYIDQDYRLDSVNIPNDGGDW